MMINDKTNDQCDCVNSFFQKHRKNRCMWLMQKEPVKDCFCSKNNSYDHRDGACLIPPKDKVKALQLRAELSLKEIQASKAVADSHNDGNITNVGV